MKAMLLPKQSGSKQTVCAWKALQAPHGSAASGTAVGLAAQFDAKTIVTAVSQSATLLSMTVQSWRLQIQPARCMHFNALRSL